MISKACRTSETWTEKDLIYTVGVVKQGNLQKLAMVYGDDYCASAETYDRIKKKIKIGVESIQGIEFSQTKELGKINKVDPLGITYLRIRGMWGIENPWKAFNYVYDQDNSKKFSFMCIINEDKWNTFENVSDLIMISKTIDTLFIKDIRIKNPNNPAQLKNAKLIEFSVGN